MLTGAQGAGVGEATQQPTMKTRKKVPTADGVGARGVGAS